MGAKGQPGGPGRNPGFTAEKQRVALKAKAEGCTDVVCAKRAGVHIDTLADWLRIGASTPEQLVGKEVSEKRRALASVFLQQWAEACEVAEAAKLAKAEIKARELEAKYNKAVDNAVQTIITAATKGLESRKVTTVEKISEKVTVTTEVQPPRPSVSAASRLVEILAPHKYGRVDRIQALALRKREAAGDIVVTQEQAEADFKTLLAMMPASTVRRLVAEVLPEDEPEPEDA